MFVFSLSVRGIPSKSTCTPPAVVVRTRACQIRLVESERTLREQTTRDRRLCLSRLPADAARLARGVRSHGAIENGLHWVLDVAMNQDRTRLRKDQAPDHLAVLPHIALNGVKQERTATLGVKNKRLAAGGNEADVRRVLTASGM